MIITVVGIQEAHYCLGTGSSVNRMEKWKGGGARKEPLNKIRQLHLSAAP